MPLVALCNLGCSKNQVDGSRMLEQIRLSGYDITDNVARADVILVNTCAFIEAARIEAIDKILEMTVYKKNGRCSLLVVCGCFSERYRATAARQIPEVDVWAGLNDWPELIAQHLHVSVQSSFVRTLKPPAATQYLKIADGCSHSCSFCAIPAIRGKYKSRTVDAVLREAAWLASKGVKECILVAQDTSYFGRDRAGSLCGLIEKLLRAAAFPWIRMMYLHPSMITDDLLRLVASEPRMCRYFDIPLQHIADDVLRAMNRRPLSKGIRAVIDRVRTIVPDSALRTSLIVGFPGETEGHFNELLSFLEETRFDKVGAFIFSPEEGTGACSMRSRPRASTAARRLEVLMGVQREISESINKSRVGRTVDVIVDGAVRSSDLPGFSREGRTQWDAPEVDGIVYIKGNALRTGDIGPVTIKNADDYDLFGTSRGE